MTITRVGSNEKYAAGWEAAFGKSKSSKAVATATASKKAASKNNKKSVAKKVTAKSASKAKPGKRPVVKKK